MGTRVLVTNLGASASTEDLHQLFAGFGAVRSVRIVRDPLTHASRGCAYVVMETAAGAAAGIGGISGKLPAERPLRIEPEDAQVIESPSARIGGQACAIGVVVYDRHQQAAAGSCA